MMARSLAAAVNLGLYLQKQSSGELVSCGTFLTMHNGVAFTRTLAPSSRTPHFFRSASYHLVQSLRSKQTRIRLAHTAQLIHATFHNTAVPIEDSATCCRFIQTPNPPWQALASLDGKPAAHQCCTRVAQRSHQCCTAIAWLPFRVTRGRPRGRADLLRDCTRPKPRTAAAPLPPEASGRSRREAGWHPAVQRQPPFPCPRRGR